MGVKGAQCDTESHTFCFPVVGVAGSLLPLRAGVCAPTLEGYPGRSPVSASSSSSSATCVRGRLEGRRCHQCQGAAVRACATPLRYHLRGSVRGHGYSLLTRCGHRAHSNSRRKRHRHHRLFWHSSYSLRTLRVGRQQGR